MTDFSRICMVKDSIKDGALCPLNKFYSCRKEKCAWWCEWTSSCAMVTIPAEISDRANDIMNTIGG